MSMLDDNLDVTYIDVIRNLVIKYLKSNCEDSDFELMNGFYIFVRDGRPIETEYDNNPANWYIVSKLFTNKLYISKYPPYGISRTEHGIGLVRLKSENPNLCYMPVTLKYILEQSTKDLSNPLYISI